MPSLDDLQREALIVARRVWNTRPLPPPPARPPGYAYAADVVRRCECCQADLRYHRGERWPYGQRWPYGLRRCTCCSGWHQVCSPCVFKHNLSWTNRFGEPLGEFLTETFPATVHFAELRICPANLHMAERLMASPAREPAGHDTVDLSFLRA